MRTVGQQIGQALLGLGQAVAGRAAWILAYRHTGQSMVEYGIVVALIAIVAFGVVQFLGQSIGQVFQNILSKLQGLNLGS
jgi:Flp pilus assembly pilin Flp